MTGPDTPGQEGPSYAPPPLPEGWIAQWDGMSRKYYFVQLSTGASQWETPTHAAPTGPTPQATPQGGLEHPYGTPGQQAQQNLDIINNPDGSQSIRHPDGTVEPVTQDRDMTSFLLNQALGGGKKHNNQGGLGALAGQFLGGSSSHNQSSGQNSQGGLGALAGQFLGGGSSHNQQNSGHSNSGSSGIVGALAGQILGGGKKPNQQQQQDYSGSQNQQHTQSSGLMGTLGGMFGGHQSSSQGGNFGYSSHNSQQGGYSGSAPPTSYQPSGTAHTSYNPPPQPQSQQHQYSQNQPPSQSYNSPQAAYGAAPNYGGPSNPQPPYGAPSAQPPYSSPNPQQQSSYGGSPNPQQPPYGSSSQQPPYGGSGQQSSYGASSQQPPYGGIQHQDSYGGGHPPQSQQYPPPPNYQGGPGYGGPGNSYQGIPNTEQPGGLYGSGPGGPPVPMGTHPHHGHNQPPQQPYGAPPGYGGQQRW